VSLWAKDVQGPLWSLRGTVNFPLLPAPPPPPPSPPPAPPVVLVADREWCGPLIGADWPLRFVASSVGEGCEAAAAAAAAVNSGAPWCAASHEEEPWLEVHFPRRTRVTDIAIQGWGDSDWVTKFKVGTKFDSLPGDVWSEGGKVYDGNTEARGVVKQPLEELGSTTVFRIVVKEWQHRAAMRVALFGCETRKTASPAPPLPVTPPSPPPLPPSDGLAERSLAVVNDRLRLFYGAKLIVEGRWPVEENPDVTLWHSVVASFDSTGSMARLYVDGQLVGEGSTPSPQENDPALAISLGYSANAQFHGVGAAKGDVSEVTYLRGEQYTPAGDLLEESQPENPEEHDSVAESVVSPQHYVKWQVANTEKYVVQANDHFVYEVLWEGQDNLAIALDLAAANGETLRDSGSLDQFGLLAHPASNLTEQASEKWLARIIRLPTSFTGQTIPHYFIACEKVDGGEATAVIRNVRFIAASKGNPVRHVVLPDMRKPKK